MASGGRGHLSTGTALTWSALRPAVRATLRRARERSRGQDLLLVAAGVTFYAAISAVPGLLVATRLAALLTGRAELLHRAGDLADALPTSLGAPDVVRGLARRAVALSWWKVVVAVFPASLYGEGLRRALASLTPVRDSFTGWRGRIAALPVLAVAPGMLLVLMGCTPWLRDLSGQGPAGRVGGVVLAFTVDWLLTSPALVWVFRLMSPRPPSWRAAAVGGVLTASFVAGFLQGFVLFLSLPLDLGAPFGGLTAVGGACAVLLWLWVLHVVVLVGYLLTVVGSGDRGHE